GSAGSINFQIRHTLASLARFPPKVGTVACLGDNLIVRVPASYGGIPVALKILQNFGVLVKRFHTAVVRAIEAMLSPESRTERSARRVSPEWRPSGRRPERIFWVARNLLFNQLLQGRRASHHPP